MENEVGVISYINVLLVSLEREKKEDFWKKKKDKIEIMKYS